MDGRAFGFPKGMPMWLCMSIEMVLASTRARRGSVSAALRKRWRWSVALATSAVRNLRREALKCDRAMQPSPHSPFPTPRKGMKKPRLDACFNRLGQPFWRFGLLFRQQRPEHLEGCVSQPFPIG